jgi:cell division protein FtsB
MSTDQKDPLKQELKSKNAKLVFVLYTLSFMAVLTVASIIGGAYYCHKANVAQQEAEKDGQELNNVILSLEKNIGDLEGEKAALKEDIERIMSETDNPSKRRAQDLERYIRDRYPDVPEELAEIIAVKTDRLCAEKDIPFVLIVGLMEVESRFNPFAESSVGARGLLQVMPEYWMKVLGINNERDFHGVEVGINAGIHVLQHYIDKNNGNVTRALQNYNGTKGNEFHEMVYQMAGRFAVYRVHLKNKKVLEVANGQKERSKNLNLSGANKGKEQHKLNLASKGS